MLAARARIRRFLPSLTANFATERLTALAQAEGRHDLDRPEVLFVCVQNAGRSQMAAGLLEQVAGDRVHVRSAGSTSWSPPRDRQASTVSTDGYWTTSSPRCQLAGCDDPVRHVDTPTSRRSVGPMTTPDPALFRLLVSCPDRPGIVAAVSRFLYEAGANIVSSAQYSTDPEGGAFFLRMEFALPSPPADIDELTRRFGDQVGDQFDMDWRLWDTRRRKRIAVLVSRYDHCLLDLLWRWRRGDLDADIELVASNHTDLRGDVESFALPYHHIPVTRDDKPAAERQLLDLLTDRVDLVVLARYMQILSGDLLHRIDVPLINIHHSFLPAFAGAGPYERAKQRGVKLVGATAH